VLHHAQIAETVNGNSIAATQTLSNLGATGYSPDQALATVNRLVDQQAYTMAATDLFYLSSALFILLIGLVWLTRPKKGGAGGGGGGAH
jgi:DHA2 family multidrug resistance protein